VIERMNATAASLAKVFKAPLAELKRVDQLLRHRLSEAAEARERERRDALDAARAAVQAHDHEAANAALERVAVEPAPAPAGIGTRWTYEVQDYDLSKVPVAYLLLDERAVRQEIATADREGREPKVPGIQFKKIAKIIARKL